MEMVVLGFAILFLVVVSISSAVREDERRKRFRRDFNKFMESNWGNYGCDSETREMLYRDYQKHGY